MRPDTSWKNRIAAPEPRLKPFVRCFAQREISAQASPVAQTALASLENILAFHLSGRPVVDYNSSTAVVPHIHLFGTQTRSPGCFSFTGSSSSFAIFFKPFASWQLFRIPPAEFADREFDAQQVFGPWITELWLRLGECRTFRGRIQIAAEALLPFAEHANPLTTTMQSAQRLLQSDPSVRIQKLADDSYMTLRTYERNFVADMGFSPKLFARLRRFQLALDRNRALGITWLDVAHELGYFDQMHMVKEFRAFGGEPPSRLVQKAGDYQPLSVDVAL